MQITGILFDKDGTLFDFAASWTGWARVVIDRLADGDAILEVAVAARVGFDLDRGAFRPDSIAIAGTASQLAAALAPVLPHVTAPEIMRRLQDGADLAPMVPVIPLAPLMAGLAARNLTLGVATNGSAHEARSQLAAAGILEVFAFVAGYDSGYGAKPLPGMCRAFADSQGLDASGVLMVGDSLHDLHAGRAAGMRTVAVLTGMASHADLAPHADLVLPHIGHLPDWLDRNMRL